MKEEKHSFIALPGKRGPQWAIALEAPGSHLGRCGGIVRSFIVKRGRAAKG